MRFSRVYESKSEPNSRNCLQNSESLVVLFVTKAENLANSEASLPAARASIPRERPLRQLHLREKAVKAARGRLDSCYYHRNELEYTLFSDRFSVFLQENFC